tara:strand:- start:78 stop:269 length:192 start_codon:yes stop_codon:yes gene_type:complete
MRSEYKQLQYQRGYNGILHILQCGVIDRGFRPWVAQTIFGPMMLMFGIGAVFGVDAAIEAFQK